MKKNPFEVAIDIDAKSAIKKIEAVTIAAEKLKHKLAELNNIEIGITVFNNKKKWYKFWK